MSLATKLPTTNNVGGWTNPNNVHVIDSINASYSNSDSSATYDTMYSIFGFDSAIPVGATINHVHVLYTVSVIASNNYTSSIKVEPYISGVPEPDSTAQLISISNGADSITNGITEITGTRAWVRDDFLDANFSVNLNGDVFQLIGSGSGSGTCDYIEIQIDYTPSGPPPLNRGPIAITRQAVKRGSFF